MDTLEHAQLALSRVQFIAEISLVADCDKKELQLALSTIAHLVELQLKAGTSTLNINQQKKQIKSTC